jgi:hypothetical protein
MIYIRSLLVGTITLVLSAVIYVVIWAWWIYRTSAPVVASPVSEISIDLSAVLTSPAFYLVAVTGFAVGFVASFRHLLPS